MAQQIHRRPAPTRRTPSGAPTGVPSRSSQNVSSGFSYSTPSHPTRDMRSGSNGSPLGSLPPWALPLAGVVVAAIVIIIIAVNLIGGAASQPKDGAAEEGVKTVEQVVQAGGTSASGGTDVQTAFAAYSWDELSAIAQEIANSGSDDAARAVADKYHLVNGAGKLTGDCKPFTLADGTQAAVQIAGFYHDDKTDGGKAGLTFIMRDSLPEKRAMNASGNNIEGWEYADLRAAIQSDDVRNQIPEEIRNKIVSVQKMTNNVGASTSSDVVSATSDDLWVFSKTELAGEVPDSDLTNGEVLSQEGWQYQLFSDCGVTNAADNQILAKKNGEDETIWWTRSSVLGLENGFYAVLKTGNADNFSYYADNEYGVVLGFCF